MKQLDQYTLAVLLQKNIIDEKDIELLNKNNNSLLNAYELWERYLEKEFADITAKGYKYNVQMFFEILLGVNNFFEIDEDIAIPSISVKDISSFFKHLSKVGYGYTTILRYKYSIKSFLDFISNEYNLIIPNIEKAVIPKRSKEIEALRDDTIRNMAEYANDLRSKLIILILYEAGIRRQELIDIKKEDIDFENNQIKIYKDGVFDRIGYISERTKRLIREYIENWEMEVDEINNKRLSRAGENGSVYKPLSISKYLFQTILSEKMSYSVVFNSIKETAYEYYANKAMQEGYSEAESKEIAEEETKNVNPEILRRSRRAFWFSERKTLEEVQAIMGDENRWVCKRYLKLSQKLYPEKFLR